MTEPYPWITNPLELKYKTMKEYSICKEFFQTAMAYRKAKDLDFILYHIANESSQGAKAGYHRKCIGVWAGVYDYCFEYKDERGYIEFKSGYNQLTEPQKVFKANLDRLGRPNGVARTPSQGMAFIYRWVDDEL